MSEELEEAKIQIKEMIQNIKDSLDLDYLNNEQAIETCKKQKASLETVLNYIDNSVDKEVIEKKIEELENSQAKVKNNKLIYSREDIFRFQIYILEEILEGK
jgi:hypothetical protein